MTIDSVASGSTLPAWNEKWNIVIPLLLPHLPETAPRTALMLACKDFQHHLTGMLDTIKFNYLSERQIGSSIERLGEWHPAASSITLTATAPAIFKKCLHALLSAHHQGTLPALKKLCLDKVQTQTLESLFEVLSAAEFVALQSIDSAFDAKHPTPELVMQIQSIPAVAPSSTDDSAKPLTMLATAKIQVKLNIPELDPKVLETLQSIRIRQGSSDATTIPKLNAEIYKRLLSSSCEKYISDEMSASCQKILVELETLNNYALVAKALSFRDNARRTNRIFCLGQKVSDSQPG